MKIKILLFFLLFIKSFSQTENGRVIYKKTMLEIKKEGQKQLDIFSQNVKKAADLNEYILTFNNNKSKCIFKENLLKNDPENAYFNNLSYIISDDFDYFFEKTNNTGIKKYNDGYYIKNEEILNWTLTNEEKKIENFRCFKALSKKKIVNHKGEHKIIDIIAWYCPELPFSFGPKEYNSLPGLILELQDNISLIVATKIEISEKKLEVDIPNVKTITQEEYEQKVLSEN